MNEKCLLCFFAITPFTWETIGRQLKSNPFLLYLSNRDDAAFISGKKWVETKSGI